MYHKFYAKNQNFKSNIKNAEAIADIITNLLIQNLDDEFNECSGNNDKFKKRLCKIHPKIKSFHYESSIVTLWK